MKTLENQMKLYLRFFKFVGQFPFKITDKELVPSTLLKTYGIIQLVILSCAVGATVIADLPMAKFREDTLRLIAYVLGMITIATTVIVATCKSSKYCSMFHQFNKIERHFHHLGISIEEQNNVYPPLKFLFTELFLMVVMVSLEYIYPYWVINVSIHSAIYYWLAMLVMIFGGVNCRTYAYLISKRYDFINGKLEHLGKEMKSDTIFVINNKNFDKNLEETQTKSRQNVSIIEYRLPNIQKKDTETAANVKLLQKCHYKLYGICNTLIEMFSYPIILIVFISALELLFVCFTGLDKILNSADVKVYEMLNWLKYSAYNLYRVTYILKSFTAIEKSGNATAYYVQRLMLKTEEAELQRKLKNFAQQLHHHKLSFSTSGFFSLDMSLLVSMTGAITTYLVILLELPGTKNIAPEVTTAATESQRID